VVVRPGLGRRVLVTNAYDLAGVRTWHRDGMIIIGDAAHAASPATGQGASMALEDAVVLAKTLRDVPDPAGGFAGVRAAPARPGGGQHDREREHERQSTAGRCEAVGAAGRGHRPAARLGHAGQLAASGTHAISSPESGVGRQRPRYSSGSAPGPLPSVRPGKRRSAARREVLNTAPLVWTRFTALPCT